MNLTVNIDWKFAAAVGASATGIIIAQKIDAAAAERVLTRAVDTTKELSLASENKT